MREAEVGVAGDAATADRSYADRLVGLESKWWRRLVDVQMPYRWKIRRLRPGFVLDVGCGLGRNLLHLRGHGVGIDHNVTALEIGRERGLTVFTPEEFAGSEFAVPGRFDSLLLAHVVEHLSADEARSMVEQYLPFVRPGGKLVIICPQQAGYRSDATHVTYFDVAGLRNLANEIEGLEVDSVTSFPFPRLVGRVFPYNEHVLVASRAGAAR